MTVERAEQGTWDISDELRDELITFVPLSSQSNRAHPREHAGIQT